jgi:hypothetical protein
LPEEETPLTILSEAIKNKPELGKQIMEYMQERDHGEWQGIEWQLLRKEFKL